MMPATRASVSLLRLGVLVSHPIQYLAPVFRSIARIDGVELTVLYRTRMGLDAYHDGGFGRDLEWDVPLLDGYRHAFLSGRRDARGFEPTVVSEIWKRQLDVLVVHGYNTATCLVAVIAARARGTVVLLRGDSRMSAKYADAPAWKRTAKRALFSLFDGYLCAGSANRRYYEAHGVEATRLFDAPLCVDNAYFALSGPKAEMARAAWRHSYGVPADAIVFAFAAKLVPRKRAHDLLAAFRELALRVPNVWLVLAGSGPEEASLRAEVHTHRVPRIVMPGFQNQSQMRDVFAAADCLVVPSEDEPFGLVVNEAMSAGLPIIVSDEVGAAEDLVVGRDTGIVYRCGDRDALRSALSLMSQSAEARRQFAERARAVIDTWNVDACVHGVVDGARIALRRSHS